MASNYYSRTTADGTTSRFSRKGTQGRKAMPEELRKVKFSARITKQTKAHVIEQARAHNMKPSFYADIALALFRMDDAGQELVKQ